MAKRGSSGSGSNDPRIASGYIGQNGGTGTGVNSQSFAPTGSTSDDRDRPRNIDSSFTVQKTGQAISATPEEAIRKTYRSDEENK